MRPATMTSAETSVGVPPTCHDEGTTAVMSSHSKALQTLAELVTSRSTLIVKCPRQDGLDDVLADASGGTMRAHRRGRTPYTMRTVEMRKRRSETLPKTCRRAEDALPYSTLD